jgi:tetratricopeptide (TPR) repeat protein
MRLQGEARDALIRGQKLLAQGDYEGSVRENQRVLSLSAHQPLGDEALFHLGLIYAHLGNPKKNYGRALGLFRKLTKDYPQSPWAEQAKIWEGMLEEDERLDQAFRKLKEENEKLNQMFRKLKEENARLNQMFKKLKEVDIVIEEKKREKAR